MRRAPWPRTGTDRLLDLALARLKDAGLVRERTTQRTDSTHILAAVRDLTRMELVTEFMRAALEELARTAPHLVTAVDRPEGHGWGTGIRDACRAVFWELVGGATARPPPSWSR